MTDPDRGQLAPDSQTVGSGASAKSPSHLAVRVGPGCASKYCSPWEDSCFGRVLCFGYGEKRRVVNCLFLATGLRGPSDIKIRESAPGQGSELQYQTQGKKGSRMAIQKQRTSTSQRMDGVVQGMRQNPGPVRMQMIRKVQGESRKSEAPCESVHRKKNSSSPSAAPCRSVQCGNPVIHIGDSMAHFHCVPYTVDPSHEKADHPKKPFPRR